MIVQVGGPIRVYPVRWQAKEDVLPREVLPVGGVDDLTSLAYLHEAAILDNLQQRLLPPTADGPTKCIYTYCGHICIAVGPWGRLHTHTPTHTYTRQYRWLRIAF